MNAIENRRKHFTSQKLTTLYTTFKNFGKVQNMTF